MDEPGSTTIQGDEAGQSLADADDPPRSCHDTTELKLEIDLQSDVGQSIDVAWLRDHLARVIPLISKSTGRSVRRLGIVIVGDDEMIRLNRQHLGEDGTTDVLSFDSADSESELIEADVVICSDEAERRASEFKLSIKRELLLYAVHGLLHCAGFDDQTETDAQVMHEEEDRLLKEIGVGTTFSASTESKDHSA